MSNSSGMTREEKMQYCKESGKYFGLYEDLDYIGWEDKELMEQVEYFDYLREREKRAGK